MRKIILLLIIFCLLICEVSFCQKIKNIQTDRPDQTECPFIVPKNHFQIETGVTYEKINTTEINFIYPTILSKFGISERFEVRLITELNTIKSNDNLLNLLQELAQ